jgi:replicative DNA helicase
MTPLEQYPYSPSFQMRIAAALLQDPGLYPRFFGIWNADRFSDPIIQTVMRSFFEFRETNKHSPHLESMMNVVVLKHDNSGDDFKAKIVETLTSLYNHEVVDKEWTEKVIVKWSRSQALEAAVIESADLLSKGQGEKIPEIIEVAYRTGEDISKIGTIITRETRKPSQVIIAQRKDKIPTGFSDLDPLIGGGLGGGEMIVFLGPPKGFKSGNMLNAMMPSIQAPYSRCATYVTLELKEEKVFERFSYRVTRMNSKDLMENPEKFDLKWEERIEQILTGRLAIKNYPTRTATATMIRNYLDLLDAQGHPTGLLVVDYGNIMKHEGKYSSDFTGVGENFESLRAIGIERDIPVITAARTNRESLQAEDLRMEHIAGSMEIAATCDYCVAIIQTDEEHRDWTMRHKLLLNRNEDCGIIIGNNVDYDTFFMTNTGIINNADTEGGDEESGGKRGFGGYGKKDTLTPSGSKTMKKMDPETMAKLKSQLKSRVKGG